ncbi:heavy metal translocating P-type ATPase [Planctomyces sp. SH-PL14]|uniref:heavy metal translocating P-type ATPase n=1 Tax=Planctomyces sp. SH-PL14 TaxID=1632864 RepID=UPI00078C73D5|nr:heavy metal translocating P-type ATPase [Planctomyces sp. SH-PL14]AMV22611.1 putative cadmium-transporting ATPase [Planctomyces sp. SH-PL14]
MRSTESSTQTLELRVAHLDCDNDAARLKRAMPHVPGLSSIEVMAKAGKIVLAFDPAATSGEALQQQLRNAGFPPQGADRPSGPPKLWNNPKVLTSAAAGLLLLAGWLLSLIGAPAAVSTTLYIAAISIGGYYFGREAIEELIFERKVRIELLMTVAALASLLLGKPGEAAMLAFLYSISEALEGYTEAKTRSAIRALMDLTPKLALVRRDGKEEQIAAAELRTGDVFIVKPGEAIPTDGEILSGRSSLDQAPVTGESVPVEKQQGDPVYAGSINAEGSLEVRATKPFAENSIARIIQMVEEAQERKGVSERFIERFGAWYSPAVLLIALGIALLPLVLSGGWHQWMIRATVFIVAAAPCALVISIPITLASTLGTAARKGVLIKGGVYVERLSAIDVVALDKTGTITRGKPEVTDVVLADAGGSVPQRDELLAIAAGIEKRSQHPLAAAIVRYADAAGISAAAVEDFQSQTGSGATGLWNGRPVRIGKPGLFARQLDASRRLTQDVTRLQAQGNTVVAIGDEEAVWGLFAIRDQVRANAKDAIAALRAAGVSRIAMLTGDNAHTADAIAREVGIDTVFADLKPEDKVARVRELGTQRKQVAMVGDGVNDAPALAEAAVGIAMGAAGTDVALETADVALMADDLEKLVYALELARRSRRIVTQNLVLSAVVIAVMVTGAVAGYFSLPWAVVAHEVSEFLVIGNGLRMLRS